MEAKVNTTKLKVLITGASGLIGGLTIRDLGHKYAFSGLSRRAAHLPCRQGRIRRCLPVTVSLGLERMPRRSPFAESGTGWNCCRSFGAPACYSSWAAHCGSTADSRAVLPRCGRW